MQCVSASSTCMCWQGTGSTGLARKLVEHPVSATEAATLAQLPLPPVLERLHRVFQALNAVYSFLLNQHIQVPAYAVLAPSRAHRCDASRCICSFVDVWKLDADYCKQHNCISGRTTAAASGRIQSSCPMQATWSTVKKSVLDLHGGSDARIEDVVAMAELCPEVVSLRDRHK